MNNLRTLLKIYFSEQCPEESLKSLINEHLHLDLFTLDNKVNKSRWYDDLLNYSNDEIKNLHQKYKEDWSYLPNKNKENNQSIFNLLVHFNEQVLVEENNVPLVVYHNFLKWKNLTAEIGEDILTTSFFAFKDIKSRKNRSFFSWRPHLFSNNKRLRSILSQGIAENHSHLYASSLNFDFSWIALMNHYELLKPTLNSFTSNSRLHKKNNRSFSNRNTDYSTLIGKAVSIRVLLYYSLEYFKTVKNRGSLIAYLESNLNIKFEHLLFGSNIEDYLEHKINFIEIKKEIEHIKFTSSYKIIDKSKSEVFDYLIPKTISDANLSEFYYLAGERQLLYNCFKNIYSLNDKDAFNNNVEILERLLYSYLTIKNDFRKEIIQLNRRYGFGNFQEYQKRKDCFFAAGNLSTLLYQKAYLDIALNLFPKDMNIVSKEFRIGIPNGNVLKFVKTREYENSVFNFKSKLDQSVIESKNEHFYVLHFFKRDTDSKNKNILLHDVVRCRDHDLRKDVRKQSLKIIEIRENHPEISKQIKGIDAASSELAARPEVFGQAFRFLKNHHLRDDNHLFKENENCTPLRITFHAGEDFLDIADGLRYVDECVKFLGMSDGDRIGHGLVLGIDIVHYYQLKDKTILLSKEMLFDNIVWLINKCKKFGLIKNHVTILQQLESLFNSLASELYINPILSKYTKSNKLNRNLSIYSTIQFNHSQFYDSWKLRGDNPEEYRDYFENNKDTLFRSKIRYWDRCAINTTNYKFDLLRSRKEICFLYYEYHFNNEIKSRGKEIKQFNITNGYIKLLKDVQHCMLTHIANRNIAIECNPSSNYLIGSIGRYSKHPIFKFNNKGLCLENEYQSPLVSVSINTDDAGIFHTSLENEYALLAIALEKEMDEDGNPKHKPNDIYDWIDHVRKMGLQQSFS